MAIKYLLTPQTLFCPVQGFSRICQEFLVSEKMHSQSFLYGGQPNSKLWGYENL